VRLIRSSGPATRQSDDLIHRDMTSEASSEDYYLNCRITYKTPHALSYYELATNIKTTQSLLAGIIRHLLSRELVLDIQLEGVPRSENDYALAY